MFAAVYTILQEFEEHSVKFWTCQNLPPTECFIYLDKLSLIQFAYRGLFLSPNQFLILPQR